MGALTSYSISTAIVLALLYIVYKCVLANSTFYRFNRGVLLTCYVVALILVPLIHHFSHAASAGNTVFASGVISLNLPTAQMYEVTVDSNFNLLGIIPIIYIFGVVVSAVITGYSYYRMFKIIRAGEKRRIEGATLVVTNTGVSPFSWGKYLVVSPEDANNHLIIKHELTHIRGFHSLDLLFAQIFTIFNWFNPAAYLMQRELSAVHEYEVDNEILKSGVKTSDYQMLLIRKAVGPGFQSIANSLNHSQLKNRLTMMLKSKSKGTRCLAAALLLPAAFVAAALTDIPAVASTIDNVAAVNYDKSNEISVSEQAEPAETPQSTPALKAVEKMPQYPGGDKALLNAIMTNVRYPEKQVKEGVNGLVIVRFVVTAEGDMTDFSIIRSSGDEALDAEAIRAVKVGAAEKWIPGTVDGKPVNCQYTLPIRFSIKSDTPKE